MERNRNISVNVVLNGLVWYAIARTLRGHRAGLRAGLVGGLLSGLVILLFGDRLEAAVDPEA
jgi:thiamine transporter ThiT